MELKVVNNFKVKIATEPCWYYQYTTTDSLATLIIISVAKSCQWSEETSRNLL